MDRKNKKGFLFVVTVFLILTYVLLSISVWVKSIEASERAYSEFYKESNVELVIEQLTDEKLDRVTSTVMNRGLLKISDHTVEYTILPGTADENVNIERVFEEWLKTGAPNASYFKGSVAPEEKNSSMTAWVNNLNASLSSIGVYVDHFEISDFRLNQTEMDKLDYSFNVTLSIKDKSGTTSVQRTYPIVNKLSIEGIPDPAIMRETDRKISSRRFFFNPKYKDAIALQPVSKGNGDAGQGWFYGYLVNYSYAGKVSINDRGRYALVGTYSEIKSVPSYEQFGALIVTSPIGTTTKTCTDTNNVVHTDEKDTFNAIEYTGTDCDPGVVPGTGYENPYIVVPGFNWASMPDCPIIGELAIDQKCLLFVSAAEPGTANFLGKKKSPKQLYDVEAMRDATLCGFYVHNERAPSFMQRLLNNSYERSSKEFGIETFIIGNYSKSVLPKSFEGKSRVDRELLKKDAAGNAIPPSGEPIRGMPGCKDSKMCGFYESPTGTFALSNDARDDYGLKDISCDKPGLARCEQ